MKFSLRKILFSLLFASLIYFLIPLSSFNSFSKTQEITIKPTSKVYTSEKLSAHNTTTIQSLNNFQPKADPPLAETFNNSTTVTRVIDGDTIELETGEKVRYIGINTPEIHHPAKPIQCFGEEAALRNSELVLNKKVRLVKDISETDRYKRLLRYVYLEDGTFVNLQLVKEGFAYVDTVPPNVKFAGLFKEAMGEARGEKIGLWQKCK
jgi:endonuclease YncB( thermonuclease family)